MVYQELVDFARGAMALGYGEDDVAQSLVAAGWREEDVTDALKVAAGLGPKQFTNAQLEAGDFDAERRLREQERLMAREQEGIVGVVRAGGEEAAHFPTVAAWFTCITNPVITFHRSRYHAGYLKAGLGYGVPLAAIAAMLIAAASFGAADFLYNAGFLADLPTDLILQASHSMRDLGLATIAGFLALTFASSVISGFVQSGALHLIARGLGGKATLRQQAYAMSIANAGGIALLVPAIPFGLLATAGLLSGAQLSVVTAVAAIIAAALAAHALVVLPIFAIREAQSLSTLRAFATVMALPVLGAIAFVAYALLT